MRATTERGLGSAHEPAVTKRLLWHDVPYATGTTPDRKFLSCRIELGQLCARNHGFDKFIQWLLHGEGS